MNLENLEKSIGYFFKDKNLLKKALTHTSYANDNNIESNEKLEFLGDSVLSYVTSDYIYHTYPEISEGEMSKVRATVVCGENLSKVAMSYNFNEYIYLGKAELSAGKKTKKTILEDSVEAIIAAMYLDGGIEPVKQFIISNLKDEIDRATKHVGVKDYKTVLQEKFQENGDVKIEYEIIKEFGPDHDKSFVAQVKVNGKILAQGEGKSKKQAQMQAAKKVLEE